MKYGLLYLLVFFLPFILSSCNTEELSVLSGKLIGVHFTSSGIIISDILGGGKIMIIGNLIKNQFLTARNWPLGSAISIFLILITFLLVKIYKKIGGKMDDLGGF
mgnify:CR=1 FL=1